MVKTITLVVEAAFECPFNYDDPILEPGDEDGLSSDSMCNLLGTPHNRQRCVGICNEGCPLRDATVTVIPSQS